MSIIPHGDDSELSLNTAIFTVNFLDGAIKYLPKTKLQTVLIIVTHLLNEIFPK